MNIILVTQQSAAKPLSENSYEEGSETISKESSLVIGETGSILTGKAEDEDIVQKSKAFLGYVEKCDFKFNNKFDYSKFEYINAKTKSIIICPIHGEFIQNMDKHYHSKYGCNNCWYVIKKELHNNYLKNLTKEIVPFSTFKKEADKIFGNKFTYNKLSYKGISSTIEINCHIHGNSTINCRNFLKSKFGCPKCGKRGRIISKTKSYENFLIKAKKIHDNKYNYPIENQNLYVNRKSIIKIECNKHGVFNKKAQKHLSGQSCFNCKIEQLINDNILVGGYSEELFSKKPFLKNQKAILYLLKVNNEYFKIGITTRNINNRIKGLKAKAKLFSENIDLKIVTIKKDSLYNCFKLEQLILQENKEFRLYKKWSTETLSKLNFQKYF